MGGYKWGDKWGNCAYNPYYGTYKYLSTDSLHAARVKLAMHVFSSSVADSSVPSFPLKAVEQDS